MNIKDIARLAGVSVSTVSKVMNRKDASISQETREKVLKTAREYNYTPYASVLTPSSKTFLIGVLLRSSSTVRTTLNGILERARELGYGILIGDLASSPENELKALSSFCKNRVDAVLWEPVGEESVRHAAELKKAGIPFLFFNSVLPGSLCLDYQSLGYAAADLLIKNRHRDIACLLSPGSRTGSFFEGYKKCLFDHQLPFREDLVFDSITPALLHRLAGHGATAVLCSHFSSAMELYERSLILHCKTPEDFSLVSLRDDGRPETPFPDISAFPIPHRQFGRYLCEQIVGLAEGLNQGGAALDSLRQNGVSRDGLNRGGSVLDDSCLHGLNQDSPDRDGLNRDDAAQDSFRLRSPSQDSPSQSGSLQDASQKAAKKQDSAEELLRTPGQPVPSSIRDFSWSPEPDSLATVGLPRTLRTKKLAVVGSCNVDVYLKVPSLPSSGRAVRTSLTSQYPGGKGVNEAVGAAKLGHRVSLITAVGNDAEGDMLYESLHRHGVDSDGIRRSGVLPTGRAYIFVEPGGDSMITILSGANDSLSPEDLKNSRRLFQDAAYVLINTEIPMETVETACLLTKESGGKTILKPAACGPLPKRLLKHIDILVPNLTELGEICPGPGSPAEKAGRLLRAGAGAVIITMGADGCLLCTPEGEEAFPAADFPAIDNTGAGDAFISALASYLLYGRDLRSAIRIAVCAAGFSITREGVVPALIDRDTLEAYLQQKDPELLKIPGNTSAEQTARLK